MTDPQPNWTAGNYNAWAAEPNTRAECFLRLQRVPKAYRDDVLRHLKTVWAIRKFEAKKRGQ